MVALCYWTIPYVAIHDWRLGVTYYLGVGMVMLSAFTSAILQQRYLDEAPVVGQAKLKLHQSASAARPAYCAGEPGCAEWDFEEATALHSASSSTFVRTFVEDRHETSTCSTPRCASGFKRNFTDAFFVASVEDFMLEVKSTVTASRWERRYCKRGASCPFAGNVKQFHGRLLGPHGEELEVSPAGEAPKYPVSRWLQAAGISSLDDSHDSYAYKELSSKNKSNRKKGLELHILVRWYNPGNLWEHLWGQPALAYEMEADFMGSASVREVLYHEVDHERGVQKRVVRKSHGLAIVVDREGNAGVFSSSLLLSEVGSKAALLGLIAAALDLLWQYVLPCFGIDYNGVVFESVKKDEHGSLVRSQTGLPFSPKVADASGPRAEGSKRD